MGVELKRNVREAWWRDMVTGHNELVAPAGAPSAYEMVGLDCSIIMHPQVWKVSGHYDLFHDFMVDCRESKKRYRHDQVQGRWVEYHRKRSLSPATPAVLILQTNSSRRRSSSSTSRQERGGAAMAGRAGLADDGQGYIDRARPGREDARHADRAAGIQPDVQDDHRRAGQRAGCRLSPPGNGPGHLRQFQERDGQHSRGHSFRHRADRQELPQRDHAAELHLPLPRVRADGNRVLLPSRASRGNGTSTGATAASNGISTWASRATGFASATTQRTS